MTGEHSPRHQLLRDAVRALELALKGERVLGAIDLLERMRAELVKSRAIPVGDRVLLRRDPEEHTSPGGIIMPFTSNSDLQIGTIMEVGSGVKERALLRVGARTVFTRVQGVKHSAGQERFAILKEEALLAVLEGEGDILNANTWGEANSA